MLQSDFETRKKKTSRLGRTVAWVHDYFVPSGKRIRKLRTELDLLTICLSSSPDAYIIWDSDTQLIVPRKAKNILDITVCDNREQFLEAFSKGDVTALEKLLDDLQEHQKPFSVVCETSAKHHLINVEGLIKKIGDNSNINILWLRDVTEATHEAERLELLKSRAEGDLNAYKTGLEKLPMPVWFRDSEYKIIGCNEAYTRTLEMNNEDVIEKQAEILGTKGALVRSMAENAKSARKPQSDKHHIIVAGERRLYEITEVYIKETNSFIGFARDATLFEEMESELKRFKASSSELLRALNTGVAIFEPDMRLSFYNDAYAQLWQMDEVWLNSKPSMSEILDSLREKRRLPEQADFRKFKDGWKTMFTSLIAPHEEMLYLPDGTAIRTLVVPHPMGGLFITYEDVTSRLQLESSYNTLIAVQRETIDNLAEGLAVIGSGGRVELFNPTYAKIWGLRKRDLADTPHITKIIEKSKKFFDDDNWDDIRQELMDSALVREERKGRLYLNDERVLEYITAMLPDGGILIRFSDVTDSLRVENALLEKNAALEAAERLKLDFLANVSYQLRTPLNAMMGFAEVLDMEYFGTLNERQKEYSVGMIDAGKKLITLINDILDLSTIEAGYFELNVQKIDVHDVLKTLFDLSHDWAGGKNIHMDFDCPVDIGTIEADERRIKQILLHLISNAIKFTPEKGQITLGANKDGKNKIALWVQDDGEGISKEDQKKVFGAFVATKQQNKGAGLGLSLVKSIVELMDGEVILDSVEGKGTKVTCILPIKNK